MSKVVPIRPELADSRTEIVAEPDLVDLFAPSGFVETLNSVAITGPQMRAAIETVAPIQVRSDADVVEHGRLLAAFARDYGFEPADYAGMPPLPGQYRQCKNGDPVGAAIGDGESSPLGRGAAHSGSSTLR